MQTAGNNFPSVTVGIVVRERFAMTEATIRAVYEQTTIPFRLIFVDCNFPEKYRRQVDEVLRGKSNALVIEQKVYMLPNACKNLVVSDSSSEYVCFIENDCIPKKGWLKAMIEACEKESAGAAIPMLFEGPQKKGKIHHDPGCVEVQEEEVGGIVFREIISGRSAAAARMHFKRNTPVTAIEAHCVLFHRSTLEAIGPFPEHYNINLHVDTSFAMLERKISILLVPGAVVSHYPPNRIYRDEKEYFFFRWNVEQAAATEKELKEKWNIREFPQGGFFARGQRWHTNPISWFFYRVFMAPRFAFGILRGSWRRRRGG